jgi:glycosyltransferase involved in cell wall biosynthesis
MSIPALSQPLRAPAGGYRPRVSIVMPTFGRAHLVSESIRCVLDQTFRDFELLIRDDASPDETQAVVAHFTDPRIRYHRNSSRLGMPRNLNEGIHYSQGDYILVCHDHDLYEPTMIEKMVEFLDGHPSALFVHAGVTFIDQKGLPTGRRYVMGYAPLTRGSRWLELMLSRFDCPVCANSMVRRVAYEQHGLYDTDFGFIADVEMWMRLSLHGDVGYIAEPLIQVRGREPDHEYSGTNWTLIDVVIRIQRLYHTRAFTGICGWRRRLRLASRIDRYLLESFLASIKRKDVRARDEGRQYLRRSGILLSRVAATIL